MPVFVLRIRHRNRLNLNRLNRSGLNQNRLNRNRLSRSRLNCNRHRHSWPVSGPWQRLFKLVFRWYLWLSKSVSRQCLRLSKTVSRQSPRFSKLGLPQCLLLFKSVLRRPFFILAAHLSFVPICLSYRPPFLLKDLVYSRKERRWFRRFQNRQMK